MTPLADGIAACTAVAIAKPAPATARATNARDLNGLLGSPSREVVRRGPAHEGEASRLAARAAAGRPCYPTLQSFGYSIVSVGGGSGLSPPVRPEPLNRYTLGPSGLINASPIGK